MVGRLHLLSSQGPTQKALQNSPLPWYRPMLTPPAWNNLPMFFSAAFHMSTHIHTNTCTRVHTHAHTHGDQVRGNRATTSDLRHTANCTVLLISDTFGLSFNNSLTSYLGLSISETFIHKNELIFHMQCPA